MAKDKITEYDATANNNTVCGDVNIAENSALPSDMNNFAREIMSHLKEGLGSGTPLYVDQTNNRLGIGETSPLGILHIKEGDSGVSSVSGDADQLVIENNAESGISILAPTNSASRIAFGDSDNNKIGQIYYNHSSNFMKFDVNNAERLRIRSDGRVGLNTSSADAEFHVEPKSGGTNSSILLSNDGRTQYFRIQNVESDDHLRISANDTKNVMHMFSNGNVTIGTTNQSPAESSSANGTRIGNTGKIQVSANGDSGIQVNRTSDDGNLVLLRQAGTVEGSITVSGSTVSYNGGHLARWSRLLDNSKDETIVKGTVMTNLDEMVEWSHDEVLWTDEDELPDGVSVGDVKTSAYTEDNEQLNKMAVSSVEGDANVAGVFVNWDDDDDSNDMNVAMTGDMVIRIAQGTTVARGDLLMSAGDGTAKPQDDDIVRSKTIAKVTSTNVSHTYDDGTYLVPCVLMAC